MKTKLGALGAILAAAALVVLLLAPTRPLRAGTVESPTQIVTARAAVTTTINAVRTGVCTTIQAAPGTGDMLAADYTVPYGCRELLVSCAFQNATTLSARINGVNLALLSGATLGADQLYGPIAVPVEPGDTVNFRLSVANNGSATRKFKVETVTGW